MAIIMLLGMNKDFKCYYFKYSNKLFRHVCIWGDVLEKKSLRKKLYSLSKPGDCWCLG